MMPDHQEALNKLVDGLRRMKQVRDKIAGDVKKVVEQLEEQQRKLALEQQLKNSTQQTQRR